MLRIKVLIGFLVGIIAFIAMLISPPKFLHSSVVKTTPTIPTTLSEAPMILEIFTEPVWVISAGSDIQTPAIEGQILHVGDQIKTGDTGRAQILYPNKSVTRLDYKTVVSIKSFTSSPQQVEVNITLNRIWSRISKLLGQEYYQTESPTVVASVRGTSYGHGILSDGRNKITSTRGIIESNCINDTEKANVIQDTKVFLFCVTTRSLMPTSISNDDKDEWFRFNEEQDRLLDERFGASIYGDGPQISDTIAQTPKATLSSSPQATHINCTGPDGKVFKATQADCDKLNNFWASQKPTATPTQKQSQTQSPTSTPTSNPTPTSIQEQINSVTVSDTGQTMTLRISGTLLTGKERVEIYDKNPLTTPYSQFGSVSLDGDLYANFSSPPCSKAYGVRVYYANNQIITWSGVITDNDRSICTQIR